MTLYFLSRKPPQLCLRYVGFRYAGELDGKSERQIRYCILKMEFDLI